VGVGRALPVPGSRFPVPAVLIPHSPFCFSPPWPKKPIDLTTKLVYNSCGSMCPARWCTCLGDLPVESQLPAKALFRTVGLSSARPILNRLPVCVEVLVVYHLSCDKHERIILKLRTGLAVKFSFPLAVGPTDVTT